MSSILIIEDDARLGRVLQAILKKEKFVSELCRTGEEGYEQALSNTYDLIMLDWSLPDMDGEAVLRALRDKGIETPILVLTARTSPEDAARIMNDGANDFVRKSMWNGKELIARIRSLLRVKSGRLTNIIEIGKLKIDLNTYQVILGKEEISLDNMDFRILACLANHSPDVVSPEVIALQVWGDHDLAVNPGTIRAHLCYIRKKIDRGHKKTRYIHTVHGRGFRLAEEKIKKPKAKPKAKKKA